MLFVLSPSGTLLLFVHNIFVFFLGPQEPHMYSFDLMLSNKLNDQEPDNIGRDHNKTEM